MNIQLRWYCIQMFIIIEVYGKIKMSNKKLMLLTRGVYLL